MTSPGWQCTAERLTYDLTWLAEYRSEADLQSRLSKLKNSSLTSALPTLTTCCTGFTLKSPGLLYVIVCLYKYKTDADIQ